MNLISNFKSHSKTIYSTFGRYFCTELKFISNNSIFLNDKEYKTDHLTNVTDRILNKIGKSLHTDINHPLGIIAARIKEFFYQNYRKGTGSPIFSIYDNLSPVVTMRQNFDSLLFPLDHISRNPSDTYYINTDTVLRSHTSAHEADLIRAGLDSFIIIGDVYRRDEIDQTHYPVFHQVEGVRLFTVTEFDRLCETHSRIGDEALLVELKMVLERLASTLLGDGLEYRWVEAEFPWTSPSLELEVNIGDGRWLEVLGCGVLKRAMIDQCGARGRSGIAFGLGLERLAMRLFGIGDIRLFWSTDEGFLSQFRSGGDIHKPITFKPLSVFPPCTCDLSFWLPATGSASFHSNDFLEIVRAVAGDLVERVELLDDYREVGEGARRSLCYRVVYRHMARTMTKAEVNAVHRRLEGAVTERLGCVVR